MSQQIDSDKKKDKTLNPEIKSYYFSGIMSFYFINILGLCISIVAFKYLEGLNKLFFFLGILTILNVTAGYLTLRFSAWLTE